MQCSEQMTGLGATLSYHRLRGWPRLVSFPLCACFLTWQTEVITTYFKELLWGVSPWVSVKRLAESLVHSRAEWVGASSLSWGVSWGIAIQRGEALLFAHGHGHFITFPHPAPLPPRRPCPPAPDNHHLAFCLCGFTGSGYFLKTESYNMWPFAWSSVLKVTVHFKILCWMSLYQANWFLLLEADEKRPFLSI